MRFQSSLDRGWANAGVLIALVLERGGPWWDFIKIAVIDWH